MLREECGINRKILRIGLGEGWDPVEASRALRSELESSGRLLCRHHDDDPSLLKRISVLAHAQEFPDCMHEDS